MTAPARPTVNVNQIRRPHRPHRRTHQPPAPVTPPRQHAQSEATRLLCVGAHLDHGLRGRVLEELVEHEERPVAPSLGVDVVSVLAHALRARTGQVRTGLMLLGIWFLFFVVDYALARSGSESARRATGIEEIAAEPASALPWFPLWPLAYAMGGLLRWLAGRAHRGSAPLRLAARLWLTGYVLLLSAALPGDSPGAWAGLVFPLLLAAPVAARHLSFIRLVRTDLSKQAFRDRPQAEVPYTGRNRRIGAAIAREQHAPLTIYDPSEPFLGAGVPYQPWSCAVELNRRPAADLNDSGDTTPLTSREIIDLIRPRLEALRECPTETGHDRLRDLEIDEVVYLPGGLTRAEMRYDPSSVERHLEGAVNEGGELRRHFLRIRVGCWHEQIVVTVLVRVHTQGGTLVLEVAPHVLLPVRSEYRAADELAEPRPREPLRIAVQALTTSPGAVFDALEELGRAATSGIRGWLGSRQETVSDGPRASVREMGSAETASLCQKMDISRYVGTVRDRIAHAVREALHATGHATDEFQERIARVTDGGVFTGGPVSGTAGRVRPIGELLR
jgi:hypothetical protein